MAEELLVLEPGDRFATISDRGEIQIWEADSDGQINQASYYQREKK